MKRKYPVTPEHIAFRKQLRRENIRAAYLQAKHRVITARLAEGRKQLALPLKEAS